MEREVPTKEAVPEYSLFFAENALQPVTEGASKEAKNIIRLFFDANFDVSELSRHVEKTDDCKQILGDSRKMELAGERCTYNIANIGSASSVSGAVLFDKVAVAVLQRQVTMSSSQNVCFSSRQAPEGQSIRMVGYAARSRKERCGRGWWRRESVTSCEVLRLVTCPNRSQN